MAQTEDNQEAWLGVLRQKGEESPRSWIIAMSLSIFLGFLGVDRFYLGSTLLGCLKLCTIGGMGWWWLIDIAILACGRMRDDDGRLVRWRKS